MVPLAEIEPPELRGARNPIGPSVGEFGILTPLELYPAPQGTPYRYRVSAGSRRFHTARDVGLTEVPAFVSSSDGSAADITGIENLGRSNNPVAEALALRKKLNQGYNLKGVADLWGASLGTLKKRAKLLELPEWVLHLVGERVAVGVVEQIAALNEPYRTQAVEALQAKVAGGPGAKFTADDLKGARVAHAEDLGDVLSAALLDTPAPLIEVDAATDLASRVMAMARNEGVDLGALAQALLDLASDGTAEEESAASPAVEAEPEPAPLGVPAPPAVNRPPSRVRATRSGVT
ncbi:hypothetical protein DEIPH_ctg139orf0090 [Deinococcus phoenicis]|uniref:ParB-like N-terminal domain-containing protein n=1 Tax=Deinococcus phoenicis TaxID=1476583 RepID=A0A016QK55_9DEIO|nr:hypothetical protein DEIPH_ctg139orf0090 [Deinococcus phoenicis]